jgi:hypothetical protein
MSILIRFTPPSMTVEQYEAVTEKLHPEHEHPDGRDYHVCFGTDGNLRVSEIWDSQEQMDAWAETLMPVLAEFGIDPGQPEVIPIHNIVKR